MRAGRPASAPNPRLVRKLLPVIAVGALVWAPATHAAPPAVSVSVDPSSAVGQAPLQVTLTALGTPATYSWSLGDGTTALGQVVHHTYRHTGHYRATVTASAGGENAHASVRITAYKLTLKSASPAVYGTRVLFRGAISPAAGRVPVVLRRDGKVVGSARTGPGGRYRIHPRITGPGAFQATGRGVTSNVLNLHVRPVLITKLQGTGELRTRLAVLARVKPASAGQLRIRVFRNGKQLRDVVRSSPARLRLKTRQPQEYRVRVTVVSIKGYTRPAETLNATVYLPRLGLGSRGPSVKLLQERLRGQHYMLRGASGGYGTDTYEAVLAFQKVHWLSRTGRVDSRFWRVLLHSSTPLPRYRGSGLHFEVDKTRQVLFDVLNGHVIRVIHVSTGATGNTPVGTFHTYSKTPGFNAKGMFDSQYFIGGFAIHGYADVPPYPASHGCVRIPIWIAPLLYETHPYGTTVYIYYS